MTVHFRREVEKLKKTILSLGTLVEEALHLAVRAVEVTDLELAEQVRAQDDAIDRLEVEIEEECLKILALYQPVAVDLRFIVTVLKINQDLERIGDHAVNITGKIRRMDPGAREVFPIDLTEISRKARAMLKQTLDAFVGLDVALAHAVRAADYEVDELKRQVRHQVEAAISQSPQYTTHLLAVQSVTRNLERVADLATNIAEDTIYLVEGYIVRHRAG